MRPSLFRTKADERAMRVSGIGGCILSSSRVGCGDLAAGKIG
jgi:hypothetical protein